MMPKLIRFCTAQRLNHCSMSAFQPGIHFLLRPYLSKPKWYILYFQVCFSLHKMSLVMRKPAFSYAKTKSQISLAVTAKLISALFFATNKVQSLFFLNTKFPASSHLVWLYSLDCVRLGRKSRRPVFSQRGSNFNYTKRRFN